MGKCPCGRVSGGYTVQRAVPLSTHIAALERDLRFGRAGHRAGRGQDQKNVPLVKGPVPGVVSRWLPCRVVAEFQQSQKG